MKELNILSKSGMLFGFVLGILSSLRYYVTYPDLDRFLAYGLVSILVIFASYLYGKVKELENNVTAIEDYLSEMNNPSESPVEDSSDEPKDLNECSNHLNECSNRLKKDIMSTLSKLTKEV